MYIQSIELKGYKRFELNSSHFKATYTAAVQFIVGTNGSGKSSLAYQLSPLPAEKDDFSKDGLKHIVITNNGKTYNLISDFSKEHVHSFIVDGVNLNDGGTVTVQKELVKKHFGYDQTIHDMIQGHKRFTLMGPSERKYWFTFLADADYDYAISVFNKVKERLSDMQGALKLAKQRLVIESSKIITEEEFNLLRSQCEGLYSNVQFLIEHREKPMGTTQSYYDRFGKLKNQVDLITQEVYKRLRYVYKNNLTTTQALEELRENLKNDYTTAVAQSNHYYEDFQHLDKLWNTWKASQLQSIANIDQEIQSAQQEIATNLKRLFFAHTEEYDPTSVMQSCDTLLEWWPAAEDRLHDNRNFNYDRKKLEEVTGQIAALKQQIGALSSTKERLQGIVDHQKAHSSDAPLQCPKCSHHFVINFDPVKLAQAQELVVAKDKEIVDLQAQLQQLEGLHYHISIYLQALNNTVFTFKQHPGLKTLLSYLIDNEILQNQPDKIPGLIQQYKADAGIRASVALAKGRIAAAQTLLEQTQGVDMSASDIEDRRNRAEQQVALCEQRKRTLQLEIETTEKNLRILTSMNDMVNQLKQHEQDIHNLANEAVENARRIEYDNLLRELQSTLATKEQALQASERQLSVIENVTQQINELTDQIEAFKILVKELSPTEGLIAEGIFSFMRKFVADMNRVIKLVWTYPLEIKPCALESEGSLVLNYKFPIVVDKDSSTRKDVSLGSSAMLEIFDLVFRVCAAKAIGLGKLPLLLDEFGKGFDNVHKSSIVHMLGTLVDLNQVDQIFVISHEFSQYTALGTSEICVLHQSNVILPPGITFNKHVTMV